MPHSWQYFDSVGTRALQFGQIATTFVSVVGGVVMIVVGDGFSVGDAANPAMKTRNPMNIIP